MKSEEMTASPSWPLAWPPGLPGLSCRGQVQVQVLVQVLVLVVLVVVMVLVVVVVLVGAVVLVVVMVEGMGVVARIVW